jgi:hypothetical protein
MLECGGCKTVFFHVDSFFSEDYGPDGRLEKRTTYYPAPAKRERPEWFSILHLESGLDSLLNETYNALDVDARVLSAIGARTVFDRVSELLKIDPLSPSRKSWTSSKRKDISQLQSART